MVSGGFLSRRPGGAGDRYELRAARRLNPRRSEGTDGGPAQRWCVLVVWWLVEWLVDTECDEPVLWPRIATK